MQWYLREAGVVFAKLVILGLTGLSVYAISEAVFPGLGTIGVAGSYAGWILASD